MEGSAKKAEPANLTILILDQNDQMVCDYELEIQAVKNGKKAGKESRFFSSTDKRGFAFFDDLPAATYTISGQKEAYTKLSPLPLQNYDVTELLCYRVYSADYVLDQVESLYKKQNYEKALELLEQVCCQDSLSLQAVLSYYKSYALAKMNQKEKAELELAKMLEFKSSAFESLKYYDAIQGLLSVSD